MWVLKGIKVNLETHLYSSSMAAIYRATSNSVKDPKHSAFRPLNKLKSRLKNDIQQTLQTSAAVEATRSEENSKTLS